MSQKPNTFEGVWCFVDRRGENECWPWRGALSRGYGQFSVSGKNKRASRIVFFLTHGFFPEMVCHTCDNPICCNPRHLFAGTSKTNVDDKMKKGRHRSLRGDKQPMSKLNEASVVKIKKMLIDPGHTLKGIGEHFGVAASTISDIKRGKTWSHV